MKKMLLAVALAVAVTPAWAAVKTVTLSVPGMTCPACPITVKKALSRVDGVHKIDVNLAKREANVTFDDTKTNPAALMKATTNAGYPSTVAR